MKTLRFLISFVLLLCCNFSVFADVSLPRIFSDHMVLQREVPVEIWGKADKGETVTVSFNGVKVSTRANRQGEWTVTLKPMAWGGPYTLTVKGKNNTLVYENVLVGDVWLCSGQSNMEWPVSESMNAAAEIAAANYPMIRSFNLQKAIEFVPVEDVNGMWEVCTPEVTGHFSAVAYYFARKIYQETGIPIGIINSSWGGTDIETWTDLNAFRELGPHYMKRYEHTKIDDFDNFMVRNNDKKRQYEEALQNDRGIVEKWYDPIMDVSSWQQMTVPGLWSGSNDLRDADGAVWFRYDVDLPDGVTFHEAVLSLGMVDDNETTWVNGKLVGETVGVGIRRLYTLPEGTLRKGKNTIAVRVMDTGGEGGIYGKAEEFELRTSEGNFPLAGNWWYKESATTRMFGYQQVSPNMYPSLLYNGMIHPLIHYRIKGAIWYQGENNANAAYDYRTLFPHMITDWRNKWGYDFPFYWVQLANFMQKHDQPVESNWAKLREAQTMTLSLAKTGQAVITDIGDMYDIHPRNKQDVGLRLALNALYHDYGRTDLVYSGPAFRSMEIEGSEVIVSFDHAEDGLVIKNRYGYVEGFAIAGSDKVFHWANGYEKNGKIVVYSDRVEKPVYIRYSWADNPDVNIFNKAGLPAVPFRTDVE